MMTKTRGGGNEWRFQKVEVSGGRKGGGSSGDRITSPSRPSLVSSRLSFVVKLHRHLCISSPRVVPKTYTCSLLLIGTRKCDRCFDLAFGLFPTVGFPLIFSPRLLSLDSRLFGPPMPMECERINYRFVSTLKIMNKPKPITAFAQIERKPFRVVSAHDLAPFLRTYFNRDLHPRKSPFNLTWAKNNENHPIIHPSRKRRPTYNPRQRLAILNRSIESFDVTNQTSQTVLFDRTFASTLVAAVDQRYEDELARFSGKQHFEGLCAICLKELVRVGDRAWNEVREGQVGWRGSEARVYFFPVSPRDMGVVVMQFDPPFE